MFELNAKEIKWIDEITLDMEAVDKTLKVALGYHANRMNECKKNEKEWRDGGFFAVTPCPVCRANISDYEGGV